MDTLDIAYALYDRKILDLQRRYGDQYDRISALEEQIDEVEIQIRFIRQEQISGDNAYQLLLTFDQLYAELTEPEMKEFMRAIIERIDIFSRKMLTGRLRVISLRMYRIRSYRQDKIAKREQHGLYLSLHITAGPDHHGF